MIYIVLNACAYSISPSIIEPYARSIRQDVFSLGTHVGVMFALCTYMRDSNFGNLYWIFLVFVFELVRDTFNMINVIWFSPLRNYPLTAALHTACMIVSIYQVAMCLIALVWFFGTASVGVSVRLLKK